LCLWPATDASWTCDPREEAEPEPDDVVEGDEDLWGRIIDGMIRRSQQQPGSEIQSTQLDSRNPDPGATLQGPGAAAPVSSEEAAEYLARLEEEFPADQGEENNA
jgi:hypothetical protein